jgi:purine-nucleoside phosphorylase
MSTPAYPLPFDTATQAAAALHARCGEAPAVAVVLGSGLGDFADALTEATAIPYAELPGFPPVGVEGHAGRLVVGLLPDGTRVAAFAGRAHLYEGHGPQSCVHGVRAFRLWGGKSIVLTNAAGGINPAFRPGDLMAITDHLNLSGHNPLTGPNDARLGPRFPDMSAAYDPAMRAVLHAAARDRDTMLKVGVYAALAGPSYETPAEIRMLRTLGADAVGMSTVVEVIAARHCGLKVAGISCITNLAAGLGHGELSHDEVKETALRARSAFIGLLQTALPRLAQPEGP